MPGPFAKIAELGSHCHQCLLPAYGKNDLELERAGGEN